MPTLNVTLPEHLNEFIESGAASGRFSDASEVVREGLQLLEQHEKEQQTKLEWLRAAVKEGFDELDRGEGIVLRSEDELRAFMQEIGAEARAELAAERKLA